LTSDRTRQREGLEAIATQYDPSNPAEHFDYWLKRLQARAATPWLRGNRVLELGCATGELASLLLPLVDEYRIVEGSQSNIDAARLRLPSVEFTFALWEEYEPEVRFSDVVAFNAVEHVEAPVELLARAARWLRTDGRLHVVVPNGLSLHRLVGAELGVLPGPLYLSESDRAQGHQRNYTIDSLRADLSDAGLRIVHWQGLFLKILANRQMLDWNWELIDALDRVARRLPEHAAELYVVAEQR